ncbi:autotransporter-associated beta strand repeat-containing protein [Pseudomonas sp. KB_12]|uniref:autotransporter-associated beta strand repeat-containing protein n=1 Tax=Pseudomonas sp. KB_12 TaxID=3233034 RepID=UPI003F99A95B
MNHVFRLVWNGRAGTFVAVSEYAKSHGKGRSGGRRGRRLRILALLLSVGMAFSSMLQAADRYWDTNGTALGSGGTGTWSLSGAFWSPNNDGVSGPYSIWNNAALDDAFFGGTAGTVTLGTPITVHNLTFQSTGYTLNGSTLTLGGITPTITVTGAATINSILAGSAGLTKAGTGTLSLNGANTFSGGVVVNAGGLTLNGDSALGAAGNGVTIAGGTSLSSTGALATSRNITLTSGSVLLSGAGVGSARFTGAGGLRLNSGVSLTNAASTYTGATIFGNGNGGSFSFNSIADLGVASSLGAATTVANGTITLGSGGGVGATLSYTGSGSSSNRNWQLNAAGTVAPLTFRNIGTGALTLTGNMVVAGGSTYGTNFNANSADMSLLGIISGNGLVSYTGSAGRTITLGNVNTYTTATGINGVTVRAGSFKDIGTASSFGAGAVGNAIGITNGAVTYTGAGDSSNRTWGLNGGAINNDGTGALALSGTLALTNTGTLGGSYVGTDNLFSGVISGTGGLAKSDASTWVVSGANTYTGSTTVNGGTLRAGSTTAFGATSGVAVNSGGTLDLNDLNITVRSLAGTGGTVDLGSGTLTLNDAAGISTAYAGNVTGSGGLVKTGASTQTLTGTNTYTGATTINGGTLRLDYGAATAPTSNIISSASTLNMGGGVLNAIGAAGEANTQTFNGLSVTGGNNTIGATSGTGGSMALNLGAITRTSGLVNFNLPGSGNLTTTNSTLGGWATVNGTNYAKVVGGNILAFTTADYVNKDNASTWLNNEILSDAGGTANSPYSGTVSGSKQIGGLQYTAAANSTVTVGAGNTLGVDGTIIVAPSVGATNQTITGGSLTGTSGGGVLGIQQNGTGNFTIASQIVDNGGSIGFTKAGTGLVTLTNANNTHTGATTVSQGILSVGNITNGGTASGIGASSAASSNLFLGGSTLRYTGLTTTSDRGFTIAKSGAILGSTVDVTSAASNLSLNGLVTSTDGANFTKTGAGTLTLGNAGNDYTGITSVTGGTLAVNTLAAGGLVSGIGASSNASGNLILNGGTLDYLGGTTSTDRGFTLGTPGAGGSVGAIGVSNAATTLTVSGTAVGDDGFRKDGAGTLVLSGTNTYSGGTSVTAGTLRAGSTTAFGSTNNNLSVASGATADLNGFNTSIGALQGLGNVNLGSATLTALAGGSYGGVISGSGGYTQAGGVQVMSGCNNTYTGATAINSSSQITVDCLANGGQASGIGAATGAASNLLFNSGSLNYTGGSVNIDHGLTIQSGFGVLNVTNATTTLGISGAVGGAGTLYKRGPGTLVLSGNNTYTGGTVVDQAGILRAGSATAFGSGYLNMGNVAGATLDANGFNPSFTWLQGGGTTGGNINLGGQTLTINTGNNTAGVAYAGNINGTGNLVKNGAQTQRMTGCNNGYTGTTTINGGTLAVDCVADGGSNSGTGASSAAASNLVINGGATLSYSGAGQSSDRLFTLGAGGGTLDSSGTGAWNLTSVGAIALSGTGVARTLTLNGTNTDNNTLSAQLDNNGAGVSSLTKTGTGTWILTNNNSSYTGVTTISGGVLGVSKLSNGGAASGIGAASSAASNLVIGNGSTLRYTGAGDSSNRLFTLASGVSFLESSGTGAVNFTNTGTIGLLSPNLARTVALGGTNTGNNTVAGVIGNSGTGITTLAKNGSGSWTLTGNNTYTGNTVINDGNLTIGDGNTSGNLGTGNVIVDAATSRLSMNRSDTVIFNATLSGPGTFAQIGTGTTTLTADNSIGATTVSAGTLGVNGVLNTSSIAMTGTSTLNVDGTVQAAGGTTAAITGDAGVSTINVNSGATLRASGDLGDGSDALTVTGTLDTGAAVLNLGAGNDTLTINDGVINGAGVDAGAGTADSLVINDALAKTFGGFSGFEQLTKQNAGTLTLTGNQNYSAGTAINGGTLDVNGTLDTSTLSMTDATTLNVDGTVRGMSGTTAILTGSAGANTININSGATLQANGSLGNGTDNVILAGTLNAGGAALDLGAGDETLTLRDGAAISGVGINAGIGNDQLLLDNALALTFNGGATAGFESLLKQNSGVTTLTGSTSFSVGATINGGGMNVVGALETPSVSLADNVTLNVDGSLQGVGGAAATLTGSAGANTLTVAAGGNLVASGDLDGGNDVLDVVGTLDTGGGAFALGGGDDTLSIHDGTHIIGAVTAGTGTDTFATDISTSADVGAVQGFETLTKTGVGALNFNGPTGSDFTTVNVLAGMLNINAAAGFTGVSDATVASGAVLNVNGSLGFTTSSDSLTVAGNVAGTGTVDMLNGDDQLTLQDGADLSGLTTAINGGLGIDTLTADIATTAALGGAVNFETLIKSNVGTLNINGPVTSQFDTVLVQGGTLNIAAGTIVDPQTTVVSSGATMTVDGTYQGTAGNDTFTVSGTVNGTGTINLLGDDDVLTLNDGADLSGLANPLDGGAHGAGDTVVLNNAGALALNGGSIVNFEFLQKDNTGTATLTGTQSFSGGTAINGGTLDVEGALTTPTVTLADNTTLNVDGSLQGAGGTAATITGSAGINTVAVNGTLDATGDLGAGDDVLDVVGTLDTLGGTFALGDGDDTFTVHDGTDVIGTIDGGAGVDTRVYDINLAVDLGQLLNFEGVTKTGTGTLNLNGPGATDLQEVSVLGGTLNIGPAGSVTATLGSTLSTVVGSGATLNVGGSYGCGDGDDSMTVSGTVSGIGTIDLCDGDDTLTLNDGAVLSNVVSGGNSITVGDIVLLNNANAFTFDVGNTTNFELLRKENAGIATLIGTQGFNSVNVMAGTLDVDGTLETSNMLLLGGTTFNVDGVVRGFNGAEAVILGDEDVNTVTIGAGGLLFATGDLAGGNDVLDVYGELNTNGGNFSGVLSLGDGDDLFTLHDGGRVDGVVYGGDGTDTAIADINLTADLGALVQFEVLTKTGSGTLNINGDTDGVLFPSTIQSVNVLEGTLNVGPDGIVAGPDDGSPFSTLVASGATLNVDGSYGCGTGNDTMTVGGAVTGSGTIDLCDGDDTLTLNDGADLSGLANALSGGNGTDTVLADIAGSAILGGVVNFETLTKTNIGTLNVDGPASSSFTTVNVLGGTLDVGAAGAINGVVTTTLASGATLNVDGVYTGSAGNDSLDVSGTVSGTGTIDLAAGDDTLTLNDDALLNNVIDGGAHGAGDIVVLNNANVLSFDAGNTINFELLQKDNTGTATLTGTQSFSGGTTINGGMLDVDGALTTPTVTLADSTTLNVDGSLQGAGGTAATITGSVGINTVTVGVGGTLLASGDLGVGNDVLDVVGTLDTQGGTFALGDGNDSFIVHDGTNIIGTIDGGAGLDTRVYDINLTADLGALVNFEGVTKTGIGTLNINGPAATDLLQVDVLGGTLNIGPSATVSVQDTTVGNGATLNVDGSFTGTSGNDTMIVAGMVTGTGTVDLLDGDDTFTVQDGADLSGLANAVDGGAGTDTFLADITGTATLGGAINFETLTKTNTGTFHVDGPASSSFTVVNVEGGTLDIGAGGAINGVLTTTVASGTTLNVDGSYTGSAGNDSFDVSGTVSGSGSIDLAAGDDTLTLNDGAVLNNVIDGGTNGAGDTVVLNNAASMTFDGGYTTNFEFLTKDNIGVATLAGTSTFSGGTALNAGTLDVDGTLNTPTVTLGDDTTLNVDGRLQAVGGTAATLTGSAGTNTVSIGVGGTLLASGDLGAGNDVLDVVGTFDTGSGTFALGDGDDRFVVHDATVVLGTVDGGAGLDTRVYDINLTANLGELLNFEGVTKTGTGVLNINGPGATDLQEVSVLGGTLNVGPSASVVATVGNTLATVVGSGATLNVDGSYGCGAGNDTMSVSGTVSGSGTIDLCDGDDTLTLNDGAVLNNVIDGGTNGAGDTVVLNNAVSMTFDGVNTTNFEFLTKDNIGVATLVGTSTFSGGTALNAGTLDVDGTLNTPTVTLGDNTTLNVDGRLQAVGGTVATFTGSAGTNTVSIGAGGTLLASGDLGAGNDVLDVAGTFDTGSGTFALGDGDDRFVVHDATVVLGTVDGGAGLDTRVYDINLTANLGELLNFEGVTKTGTGVLNINGPGATDLQEVSVLGGTLNVGPNAGVVATAGNTLATVVGSGATLNVDGSYGCGAGNDTMSVSGTVSGSGTIDLCDGDDTLTLNDGAVLAAVIDGGGHAIGDTVVLNNAASMTFDSVNTTNFEFLTKDNIGVATLVGTSNFSGGTALNAGTLNVNGTLNTPTVTLGDNTTLNVDGRLQAVGGTVATLTGSAGTNTVSIGAGGTLLSSGDLGAGNDVLDVAGTLDTGSGIFALGDGDDTLTIHDGTNLLGTVAAGAGTDVFNADISVSADLGAVQSFETLNKTDVGVLNINGPLGSEFITVNVLAGTLIVGANGSVVAQNTTVAGGATLDAQGSYSGTAADDSFTSRGTVRGMLDFGAGNDSVSFIGGDLSGLRSLGGGDGDDRLSFSGLDLSTGAPVLNNWERVELADSSVFSLASPLDLNGGLLTIGSTSRLLARAGANVGGSVHNDGQIDVGSHRLAISGDYSGNGALDVQVAASAGTSGGLDIGGDVVGTTRVSFANDGTEAQPGATIRVISSPNDNPSTAGGFVSDQTVRLNGSVLAWNFAQGKNDSDWYLSSADKLLLPEIPGYTVVPDIGYSMTLDNNRLLFDRMAGGRGDNPYCNRSEEERTRIGLEWFGTCEGLWLATIGSHLSMESNPGFEFDGNSTGLYAGYDHLFVDEQAYRMRGGLFIGQQQGNYSTTGDSSTGLVSVGRSNVDMEALAFGAYGSLDWQNGTYADMSLTVLLPDTHVRSADGFSEQIRGDILSLSGQVGHRYPLSNGWVVEPQFQASAIQMRWDDKTDSSGKQLNIKDDVLGLVRTAVRVEKTVKTDGGATLTPWLAVGLQDTLGENSTNLEVTLPGGTRQNFSGHDLGLNATLDVGLEAQVTQDLRVFGTASVIGANLGGNDVSQQQVSVGVRWSW